MTTILFSFALVFHGTAVVALQEGLCSWCEAGDATCDWSYDQYALDIFTTSVSPLVDGRGFPYHRPAAQAPLEKGCAECEIAIIVHHGAGRNGEDYTSYMTNAVLRAGMDLSKVAVLGPQVYEAGDEDLDESKYLWWAQTSDDGTDEDGGERDWKWGGNSTVELPASISTFEVLDEMLLTLSDPALYPALQRVVFSGHSAGGQIIQRYALFSKVDSGSSEGGVAVPPVSYFAANPSSVTYLGPERPVEDEATKTCGTYCDNATIADQVWSFAVPNSTTSGCEGTYDEYGYGLQGALPPYPSSVGAEAALAQYPTRAVTYLSGSSDVCDAPFMASHGCTKGACVPEDGGLDTSCEAYAQGWCRMARFHAFQQFVSWFYEEERGIDLQGRHSLLSVPGVGHSGCGMFQSAEFADAALLVASSDGSDGSSNINSKHVHKAPEAFTVTAAEKGPTAASLTGTVPFVVPTSEAVGADYDYFCFPADACEAADPLQGERKSKGGSVLMGGGSDVDAAFQWQIDRAGGGDFVVLRESGTDAYNSYIWDLAGGSGGKLRSVSTLILNSERASADSDVLAIVKNADAIFFAGGDQSKYVSRIAGSSLEALLRGMAPLVSIGGTSAGNAIQGLWVYTGVHGSAVSSSSLLNPYEYAVNGALVSSLLNVPSLDDAHKGGVVMDDHFVARDRMGRLLVFMGRLAQDGAVPTNADTSDLTSNASSAVVRGIGVDEATALLLDPTGNTTTGGPTLTAVGDGTAYACELSSDSLRAMTCKEGEPLSVPAVACERLTAAGFYNYSDPAAGTFDLAAWKGSGVRYTFDVDNGVITGDPYGP